MLWVVSVASALACSAAPSAPAGTVTDSAGIRILTWDLTDVDVPVLATLGPADLTVGVRDGAPEYSLSSIPSLAVADDGMLLVSDEVAKEIRLFDREGDFVRTLGRPGDGPGEFARGPTIVGLAGDTVFAFDSRSARLSSFSLGGEFISAISVGAGSAARSVSMIRQRDGSYLSLSPWTNPASASTLHELRLVVDSLVIERLDAGAELLDTLQVVDDRTRARMSQNTGGGRIRTVQGDPPFQARGFLRSDGERAILAHSRTFELRLLDPSGRPASIVRVVAAENPMTGDELRARQETALREEFGEDPDPMMRRLLLDFLPDGLPAFDAVVVADNGDVWMSRAEFDASTGYDWLVFDSGGGLRGSVHTPPRFHLRVVGDDGLVGVLIDELDVPYVQRYSLHRN